MKWPKLLTEITDIFKKKEVHPTTGKEVKTLNPHSPIVAKGQNRPPGDVVTWKFSTDQRRLILNMIAHCMTNREIEKRVREDIGMDISSLQITRYRNSKKWKGYIQKEREIFLASVNETPGFHEKVRLGRADDIYEKAVEQGELKVAIQAIDQQRKELKEGKQQPVSFVFQQYNSLSDDELEDKYNNALAKIAKHKLKTITVTPTTPTPEGKNG